MLILGQNSIAAYMIDLEGIRMLYDQPIDRDQRIIGITDIVTEGEK